MGTANVVPATLGAILSVCRGHGGTAEKTFVEGWLWGQLPADREMDTHGNVWITVGEGSRTLFCAHTDTVHDSKLSVQQVWYDPNTQELFKDKDDEQQACLGADDGAGIWLLLEMINAGVPGTYVFFRGEERGGVGSSGAAVSEAERFVGIDRAIAFDRRGLSDVITHQGGTRCASDDFAKALAAEFNSKGHALEYKPCDSGVFTDTANLTDIVPECTNISCGYYSEHSSSETLNLGHLLVLRDACVKADWENLPTVRKAGEYDSLWGGYDWRDYGYGGYGSRTTDYTPKRTKSRYASMYDDVEVNDLVSMSVEEIDDFVYENPDRASELIRIMLDELLYVTEEPPALAPVQSDLQTLRHWAALKKASKRRGCTVCLSPAAIHIKQNAKTVCTTTTLQGVEAFLARPRKEQNDDNL